MKSMLVWALTFSLFFSSALASVHVPFEELIQSRFDQCQRTKENLFLTAEQKKEIETALDSKLHSSLALRYRVDCRGKAPKFVYVDSHIVRTLNETVVFEIDDNKIERVEISQFMEPTEYLPPMAWIKQIIGKSHIRELEMKKNIDALTGATLSARAILDSSRRILVMHSVLQKI